AIYLEEYARDSRLRRLIQTNINNLAGVPSIVYGLLGLSLFVQALALGRSVLAGALTLTLMSLPVIIIAAQEAIRSVPEAHRLGAYALGATRWQMVRHIVLPAAFPGMLTGTILAMSRAIGEAAPIIAISALVYLTFIPNSPMDRFTVLPIQIFNWISRPQADFQHLAAAGIIVLLVVLLSMNAVAIFLRNRYQKRVRE
ncbi:MAG: phosphate ABC transporter permease PstA, partial [Chloroflexi bacterium]|nr:phosphate ABC transporter permease PstA [Chloroflexota bacterium]